MVRQVIPVVSGNPDADLTGEAIARNHTKHTVSYSEIAVPPGRRNRNVTVVHVAMVVSRFFPLSRLYRSMVDDIHALRAAQCVRNQIPRPMCRVGAIVDALTWKDQQMILVASEDHKDIGGKGADRKQEICC